MNLLEILTKWLQIDYYYMYSRLGFGKAATNADYSLILETIRVIDHETSSNEGFNVNAIIAIMALLWEHVDQSIYDLKDFFIKILSRIGYPTSAIIADSDYDSELCQFSPVRSVVDKLTVSLLQSRNEVNVGESSFLLTDFQMKLWNTMNTQDLVGVSAPTSAGKSFVLLINTIMHMMDDQIDIIYIVPTLSLQNQVTEDYNNMLHKVNIQDFLITNSMEIGDSEANHTVYIWTQEKAISMLSSEDFEGMPHKTIVIVDEIQNVERIQDDNDVRAKILFDTLQEIRHTSNICKIIISGPRINNIATLGLTLFGETTSEVSTYNSPVLSLTYSIKRVGEKYYFKQYCGVLDNPFEHEIENSGIISGYGYSSVSSEYLKYLSSIIDRLHPDQNIVFAPTTKASRDMAAVLSQGASEVDDARISDLITYYAETINEKYLLCLTLKNGIAYHHGKLPVHVRRTIEKAIKNRLVSNVVCTTTLMQGVNLPAQNIVIRNPHLYTKNRENSSELTNYEMANLRGRAGRLLKDFIGRTIVLDEDEFELTEGFESDSLFDDVEKEINSSYRDRFEEHKEEILEAINHDSLVNNNMVGYGYLVTYIRQTVLRHGDVAARRMAETGVILTKEQVAAIIMKMNNLEVPKHICIQNRYWDPLVLDDIYKKFKGGVPSFPTERGAKNKLSNLLKFLRDNDSSSSMYERYIPEQYQKGKARGLLCSYCILWSSEKKLSEILVGDYFTGEEATEHIERVIQLLQETVSFSVPLLIKPIIEMRNSNSAIVFCLQAGAYRTLTRKMIEIGVPRELAIRIHDSFLEELPEDTNMTRYEVEQYLREKLQEIMPQLSYWEQVQLDFLKR